MLSFRSMVAIEFFVWRIQFNRLVVVRNSACRILFSMPSQTPQVIRAGVVWIQRECAIKIDNGVVEVLDLAIEQTTTAVSRGIPGTECDLMTEFNDFSVELGDR